MIIDIYLDNYFFIIQIEYRFLDIIAIINRLFFHFVTILVDNNIGVEGAKALAEALKFNKNLTKLNLCKILILFTLNIYSILSG